MRTSTFAPLLLSLLNATLVKGSNIPRSESTATITTKPSTFTTTLMFGMNHQQQMYQFYAPNNTYGSIVKVDGDTVVYSVACSTTDPACTKGGTSYITAAPSMYQHYSSETMLGQMGSDPKATTMLTALSYDKCTVTGTTEATCTYMHPLPMAGTGKPETTTLKTTAVLTGSQLDYHALTVTGGADLLTTGAASTTSSGATSSGVAHSAHVPRETGVVGAAAMAAAVMYAF